MVKEIRAVTRQQSSALKPNNPQGTDLLAECASFPS